MQHEFVVDAMYKQVECCRMQTSCTHVAATATEAEIRAFINELNVMKSVGRHVNVVAFVGCCTKLGQGQFILVTSLTGGVNL